MDMTTAPPGPTMSAAPLDFVFDAWEGGTPSWYVVFKRTFDVLAAASLLLFTAPVLGLLMVLVARDGGPVFFAHARVGEGGRVFDCLKLRTMRTDADAVLARHLATDPRAREEWAARCKLVRDPRITSVGRFLRKASLDELPQLVNVLRGEMSLVGPRPVPAAELLRYGRERPSYFACPPGLTGLWQVSARGACGYRRRVAYDRFYARHRCFGLDLVILLRTVGVVLLGRGE